MIVLIIFEKQMFILEDENDIVWMIGK